MSQNQKNPEKPHDPVDFLIRASAKHTGNQPSIAGLQLAQAFAECGMVIPSLEFVQKGIQIQKETDKND